MLTIPCRPTSPFSNPRFLVVSSDLGFTPQGEQTPVGPSFRRVAGRAPEVPPC
jgi:hypothetical protein